jgi:hypothetical protein
MARSKPNFKPTPSPTALSERYSKAGFGILNKPRQSKLHGAVPSDFTWLSNISHCVSIFQSAQRDALSKAQASKDKIDTPEQMCGGQIQLMSEQECGQQSYADYELDWAILSYEVELAPFRTGTTAPNMSVAPWTGCLESHHCKRTLSAYADAEWLRPTKSPAKALADNATDVKLNVTNTGSPGVLRNRPPFGSGASAWSRKGLLSVQSVLR